MEQSIAEMQSAQENTNPGTQYIEDLKKQLGESSEVFYSFLKIVCDYGQNKVSIEMMVDSVSKLLAGKKDLLLRFYSFVPDKYCPKSDFSQQVEADSCDFKLVEQFINRIKDRFQDSDSHVYSEFISLLRNHRSQQEPLSVVEEKIKRLFHGHPDLINDFLMFLPKETPTEPVPLPNLPPQQPYLFQPPQPFVPMPPVAVVPVSTFQPPFKAIPPPVLSPMNQTALHFIDENMERIKEAAGDSNFRHFLRICKLLGEKLISLAEFVGMTRSLFRCNPSAWEAVMDLLVKQGIPKGIITESPPALLPEHVKKLPKCTPSYHQLPSEYLHRGGSQRSYREGRLLNDNWISCPIGSEDFAAGYAHRNTYAEALFRVEDDHFECDVLIETNRHCIGTLEVLLQELKSQVKDEPLRLNVESLSQLDRRAIRRLYAESGVDLVVMDMLSLAPLTTLPRLLKRLREQEERWMKEKKVLEGHWSKVQEENYHRSLDTRSYTFKVQDKKTVNGKMFIDSLRAIANERVSSLLPSEYARCKREGFDRQPAHLQYVLMTPMVHRIVLRFLLAAGKKQLPYSDMKRFRTFLFYSVCTLFGFSKQLIEDCELENALFTQDKTHIDPAISSVKSVDSEHVPETHGVFFVNSAIYVFYRFYEVLYSRVEQVIRILFSPSHHLSEFHVAQPIQREAQLIPSTSALKAREEVNNLVNMCLQFLRNEVDSLRFEEYCRHHVGAGGFVLYTLDKVTMSCVKQLHSVLADFTTNELMASFAAYQEQTPISQINQANKVNQVNQVINEGKVVNESSPSAVRDKTSQSMSSGNPDKATIQTDQTNQTNQTNQSSESTQSLQSTQPLESTQSSDATHVSSQFIASTNPVQSSDKTIENNEPIAPIQSTLSSQASQIPPSIQTTQSTQPTKATLSSESLQAPETRETGQLTQSLQSSNPFHKNEDQRGSIDGYRDRCIHVLQHVHQAMYRIENDNGALKMWLVGNAAELMPIAHEISAADEFSRVARDFLLMRQPVGGNDVRRSDGKRSRSESSSLGSMELEGNEDESESTDESLRRIKVRKRGGRRRNKDDDDWDSH